MSLQLSLHWLVLCGKMHYQNEIYEFLDYFLISWTEKNIITGKQVPIWWSYISLFKKPEVFLSLAVLVYLPLFLTMWMVVCIRSLCKLVHRFCKSLEVLSLTTHL